MYFNAILCYALANLILTPDSGIGLDSFLIMKKTEKAGASYVVY